MITVVSFTSTTLPWRPPMVTTLSPFCRLSRYFCSSLAFFDWGRMKNSQKTTMRRMMKMKYTFQRFSKSISYICTTMRACSQKRYHFGITVIGRCGIDLKSKCMKIQSHKFNIQYKSQSMRLPFHYSYPKFVKHNCRMISLQYDRYTWANQMSC